VIKGASQALRMGQRAQGQGGALTVYFAPMYHARLAVFYIIVAFVYWPSPIRSSLGSSPLLVVGPVGCICKR
jgi:hypothetical protein